jgi:hypothetical protein
MTVKHCRSTKGRLIVHLPYKKALAASLVRSLFCGLPHPEHRMAIFVSASDEHSGKDRHGNFFFGGWLAPEEDWSRFFAPAWQERVLNGAPRIPYLHMTDIRSRAWREEHGLSREEADCRIDEAIAVIDQLGSLYPIGIDVDGGHFREELKEAKIIVASGAAKTFEPDYMCFLGYAWFVLSYIERVHPGTEKVDFIVERNGEITKHIQEFHEHLGENLKAVGRESLIGLLGELIPAGKESTPLQAADVLCWHTGRARQPDTKWTAQDIRRYRKLVKRGARFPMRHDMIEQLKKDIAARSASMKIRIAI